MTYLKVQLKKNLKDVKIYFHNTPNAAYKISISFIGY